MSTRSSPGRAAASGPVVVYANAATPRGIDEPAVGRFLGGLADAGFVAIAPELPCVRRGEVTPETIDALVSVAGASGRRVALIGASTGAGLAIIAAGDPRIADRVTRWRRSRRSRASATSCGSGRPGYYGDRPFDAAPLVGTAAARSLAASAPDDPAVPALLANRIPRDSTSCTPRSRLRHERFVEELSPLSRIGAVAAPIEIASSPSDPFFPVEESLALAEAGRDVRLTVTPALLHVKPCLRPGLVRLVTLLDRTLARASYAEPVPALRPSVA